MYHGIPPAVEADLMRLTDRPGQLKDAIERAGASTGDPDKSAEAAREFESFFLYYMIKVMRKTVPECDLFGERKAEKLYQSMLDEQIAHHLATRKALGLADMILQELQGPGELPDRRLAPVETAFLAPVMPHAEPLELVLPSTARVTSVFGERIDPFSGERRHHDGIDIALPEGAPVRAAAPGTVVFSGEMRGYGKVVILQHADGVETVYAHNRANNVAVGQPVAQGDVVAEVGQTGRATGPHLHFEVRRGGTPVDPEVLLDNSKV